MPTVRDDVLLDDRYVLVVDWIEGTSSAQILAERGDPGLPVTTVLGWLPDIASALDHLHAQRPSVVHGDVRLGEHHRHRREPRSARVRCRGASERGRHVDCRRRAAAREHGRVAVDGERAEAGRADRVGRRRARAREAPRPRVAPPRSDPDAARRPATASELVERLQGARETALPTGVVTFVLTDIEGSTPLWEAHPKVMAEVIARHHELAAEIAEAHGGRMPRSQGEGDSTLSAFARATDAVAAAIAFQRALAEEPFPEDIHLSVRAGHAHRRSAAGEGRLSRLPR